MKKYDEAEKRTREFYKKAGITVLESEPIEIADFGKNNLEKIGLQLCVYINTERVCAKEMVLFPHQTCPEHKHVETDVYHEIALTPGMQHTIYPGTLHWFQAGDEGAVISEFSTRSTDETDVFTDKSIIR